jgi:hypothetical protein
MGSKHSAKPVIPQSPEAASKEQPCCSSPTSMCYWCAISLVAWGLLSLLGIYWRPLRANSAATILLAAAIGCFANWFKNRTFHCGITAWIFLAGAALFLVTDLGTIQVEPRLVWPFIGAGTLFAFILEWRFAHRGANQHL